jgi:hypothetical protein
MEKRYYGAESLERSLLDLERRHSMSSADFYERATTDGAVPGVPQFDRSVWASLYRDFLRLRDDDFAMSVERTVARL